MLLPEWHPMVVHFPLALGVSSALFLLAARLVRDQRRAATLATVGTWNLCVGAVAALFALATGVAAVVDLHVGAAAHQAISTHLKWAIFTTLALVLLAVWRGAGSAWDSRPGWPFVVVLLAATAALVVTGYRGGQNVYRYGIGVHGAISAGPAAINDDAVRPLRAPHGGGVTALAGQFFHQSVRVIDVPQRFGDAGDVDGNRPINGAVITEVPAERLDVAVKDQTDHLAAASDHRRS